MAAARSAQFGTVSREIALAIAGCLGLGLPFLAMAAGYERAPFTCRSPSGSGSVPPRDHPHLPCRHAGAAAAGAGPDVIQFVFALVDRWEIQREAAAGS